MTAFPSSPDGSTIIMAVDMDQPSLQSRGSARPSSPGEIALRQVGLVGHPTRPLAPARGEVGAWASAHGLMVGQVPIPGQTREVADPVAAAACDLLLGIG